MGVECGGGGGLSLQRVPGVNLSAVLENWEDEEGGKQVRKDREMREGEREGEMEGRVRRSEGGGEADGGERQGR